MESMIQPYTSTILALGAMAALMLLQTIVIDVVGIKRRHTPGAQVETDHGNLLFRVTRTHANTNEVIGTFILLVLFCLFSAAEPGWVNALSWLFVGARMAYAVFYYLGTGFLRSAAFSVCLLAMLGLLWAGGKVWL